MRSVRFIPSDLLKPFIKSYLITESAQEKTYTVLPDTGLVLGFQFSGRLSVLENSKTRSLDISGLTGLLDGFRVFKNTGQTRSLLVFLKEAGAPAFFKQAAHEFFGQSLALDDLILRSDIQRVEEQLNQAGTDLQKIQVIEAFLTARIDPPATDQLVLAALSLIDQTKGNIRIREIMQELHTSQSPLEKRFRQVVGASPKKFASIVRLKNLIEHYDPRHSLTAWGYQAGFYDQSHFIKEFKLFSGETPEIFFKNK
jgi:AraC-like DNA-binding protein